MVPALTTSPSSGSQLLRVNSEIRKERKKENKQKKPFPSDASELGVLIHGHAAPYMFRVDNTS